MKKQKSFFVTLLFVCFVACLGFAFQSITPTITMAQIFESDELEVSVSPINDGTYSRAMVVSGTKSGQSAKITSKVNGNFQVNFEIPQIGGKDVLTDLEFEFKDASGKIFSIGYLQETAFRGFYVGINDEKAGISYHTSGSLHTSLDNAKGIYTAVSSKNINLRFENKTMRIYGSSEGNEKLVWDFSKRANDGRDIGIVLDSFTNYEVNVKFVKVEYNSLPRIYVYNINGQSFSSTVLTDNAGPEIFANIDSAPVKQQSYKIPKPLIYDVIDGEINCYNADVKITDSVGQVKLSQKYADNLTYTFVDAGKYTITYSAKDNSNNESSITFDVSVFDMVDVENTFNYSFSFDHLQDEYGAGSKVTLPCAKVVSTLSMKNNAFDAIVNVYKDDSLNPLNDYTDLSANDNFEIVFTDAGIYKIVYSADSDTLQATDTYYINVKEGKAYLQVSGFKTDYLLGEELDLPNAKIVFGNKSFDAVKRIVYPSGASYINNTVLLNETGEYTVQYSAITNDGNFQFNKKFNVVSTGADLFEDKNDKSEFYESNLYYLEQESGVMLSMRSGAEVRFKNPINISGNGMRDFFINYYIVPNSVGTADFGALRIRLTDIYDENNYVDILSKDSGMVNTGGVGAYVQSAPYGQTLGSGYEDSFDRRQTTADGFTTLAGFRGMVFFTNGYTDLKGGFAIEDSTKRLYSATSYAFSIAGTHSTLRYITDLDNPNYYEVPWQGFTTGECYLTIIPEQVGSRANVLITSVGGVSLSSDIDKTVKTPSISIVDYKDSLPDGIVNVDYPLPDAYAFSKYYGVLDLEKHVYLNINGFLSEVNINDGKFVPKQVGKYTLIYKAYNPDGLVKEEKYNIEIKETLPNFSLAIKEDEEISLGYVGDSLTIAGYQVENASGNANVTITVTSPRGEERVLYDNRFVPDLNGKWSVKYEAIDYLSRKSSDSYVVQVESYDIPVIKSDASLPAGFINGFTYEIPDLYAYDYTVNVLEPAKIKGDIYVTDANGEKKLASDRKYVSKVSSHNSDILVKYVFTASNGKSVTKQYTVKGLIVKDGNNIDMSNYFVTDGIVSVTPSSEYTSFSFSQDNASIEFSRSILASGAKVTFNIDQEANNFETIRVIMRDSVNSDERIEFTVSKKGETYQNSYFCLNNGWTKNTVGSFFGNSSQVFSYTFNGMSKTISDGSGVSIAKVDKTIYGEDFNGFTSGKIYVKFIFENVTGNSTFVLYNIAGQTISNRRSDNVKPTMLIKNSIAGTYAMNSVVTVSDILTSDVLSEITSATVEVTLNDGTVILSERSALSAYSLTLSNYGVYWITYTVKDGANRTYTDTERLYVRGNVEPRLEVSGAISNTASLNSSLTVPGAVVHDGSGNNKYVVVAIDPNGQMYTVNGTVTFNIAGKWVIRYFAYDRFYNCSTVNYTVNVK